MAIGGEGRHLKNATLTPPPNGLNYTKMENIPINILQVPESMIAFLKRNGMIVESQKHSVTVGEVILLKNENNKKNKVSA